MPAPYSNITVSNDIKDYMRLVLGGRIKTCDCLMDAFAQIGAGTIPYGPDILEPQHLAVDRCRHTILFSINELINEVYITEVIYPARNGLRGIIP